MQFDAAINPCGITYNPISIAWQIEAALAGKRVSADEVFKHQGIYSHHQFHGKFNSPDLKNLVDSTDLALENLGKRLRNCDFFFLTFGTSIVFELKSTKEVVNNCHKRSSVDFEKRMLSISEMEDKMNAAIAKVKAINPAVSIVTTVSPIRHLRHGAVSNQRSKAKLIQLCEEIEKMASYLPVYEMVMDELRDYRFYRQDDLIHMNDGGLNLVRERFLNNFCESDTLQLIEEVKKWLRLKNHRVINPDSEEHKKFERKLNELTAKLEKKIPGRFS